jgi:biopolymer transport protein ExbD
MKIASGKKVSAEIPTASMADIVFLLIIFFMLTTTFSVNKGFDFGLPPVEANQEVAPEEVETQASLTIIVYGIAGGMLKTDYEILVMDEKGERQNFTRANLKGNLMQHMRNAFETVKGQGETAGQKNWYELPVYVLVRADAPWEGFVDVWEEVKTFEKEIVKEFPPTVKEEDRRLQTHVPHVDKVAEYLARYEADPAINLVLPE